MYMAYTFRRNMHIAYVRSAICILRVIRGAIYIYCVGRVRSLHWPCPFLQYFRYTVVFGFPDFSQQFGPAYSDPAARSVVKSGPHCPTSAAENPMRYGCNGAPENHFLNPY